MNSTVCLNNGCPICETVKRTRFFDYGLDEGASMTIQEINRVYFTDMKDDVAICKDCEYFHDCKCAMEDIAEPKREKKTKTNQKFRPQRATPKGEGHRWKAVEKTTTTWGSPADKARKRAVMAVKQQRKWREAFMSEEETNYDTPVKIRTIRKPIRDRPCKPGFVEYTGKGWPKC
jgi:hypothetical protein